jgi:hypothetical protein
MSSMKIQRMLGLLVAWQVQPVRRRSSRQSMGVNRFMGRLSYDVKPLISQRERPKAQALLSSLLASDEDGL